MPSLTALFSRVNQIIGDNIHQNLINIGDQIKKEHGIDITKYTDRVAVVIDSDNHSKRSGHRGSKLDPELQCRARTANKTQCSRRHKKGLKYCGCHEHNQPNGTVDDEVYIHPHNVPSIAPPHIDETGQATSEDGFHDCDLLEHDGNKYIVYNDTIYLLPEDTVDGGVVDQSKLVKSGTIKDGVPCWELS